VAYLKRIQLVKGAVALAFAPQDYQHDFLKCKRYYQKSFPRGTAVAQNAGTTGAYILISPFTGNTAGSLGFYITLTPDMRIAPTITTYNPSAANAQARNSTDTADDVDTGSTAVGTGYFHIFLTPNAANTLSDGHRVHWTANARLT
jgi:hypothetical protein